MAITNSSTDCAKCRTPSMKAAAYKKVCVCMCACVSVSVCDSMRYRGGSKQGGQKRVMGNSRQRKRTQMTDDSRRRKGIRGEETWETSPLIKYLQGEKKSLN